MLFIHVEWLLNGLVHKENGDLLGMLSWIIVTSWYKAFARENVCSARSAEFRTRCEFCLALGQSFGGSGQWGKCSNNEHKALHRGKSKWASLGEDRKTVGGWWKWVQLGKYEGGVMGEGEGVGGGCKRCLSRSRIWCSVWWSCCEELEGS